MDLTKIISISGKSGLFNLIKQSRGGFIVESIETKIKLSIPSSNNVSLLANVAMYTAEGEVSLQDVFTKIAAKENAGVCISHKESGAKLHEYFSSILPTYDKSRVYDSDLKKLFQWYNILQKSGMIVITEEAPQTETVENEKKETKKTTAKKTVKKESTTAEEKPKTKKTTPKTKKKES